MTSYRTKTTPARSGRQMRAGRDKRTTAQMRRDGAVRILLGIAGVMLVGLVAWVLIRAVATVLAVARAVGDAARGHGVAGLICIGVLAALIVASRSGRRWR